MNMNMFYFITTNILEPSICSSHTALKVTFVTPGSMGVPFYNGKPVQQLA